MGVNVAYPGRDGAHSAAACDSLFPTGAELVPLRELAGALGAIPRDKPIVTVCRSGGRSAQAFVLLKRAGVERVANLTGGMLRWHENGLPVSHRD